MSVCPTVWEAISDLPNPEDFPELIDGDRVPYEKPPSSPYERIMRGLDIDLDDLSPRVDWDDRVCTNIRRTQHGKDLLERFSRLGFGEIDRMSGIRRLDPNDVSTTIRAGTTKDRGAWSAPRPLHPYQDRVLTTRECARLQSFPDWFVFHPAKWHGNRQVGNAVPPMLSRAIGKRILKLLGVERGLRITQSLPRDTTSVTGDVEKAKMSGLSRRRVSQQVVHPGRIERNQAVR